VPEIPDDEEEEEEEAPIPKSPLAWLRDMISNGFIYAFLVFGLVVFVRECLGISDIVEQPTPFLGKAAGILEAAGVIYSTVLRPSSGQKGVRHEPTGLHCYRPDFAADG